MGIEGSPEDGLVLVWVLPEGSTEWFARVGAFTATVLDEPGSTFWGYHLGVNINGHRIELPHNPGNDDDRLCFASLLEAKQAAERALAKLGVQLGGTPAPERVETERRNDALVEELCSVFLCHPRDLLALARKAADRARRRGAVQGEVLPAIGLLHAKAQYLARFVLAGDTERARELADELANKAERAAEMIELSAGHIGLRGWWTAVLAQSMADMIRSGHEAGFGAAIDVSTSEGPICFFIRRGRFVDHQSEIEKRNAVLSERVRKMAKLLDTLCGLVCAGRECGRELDLDEIGDRLGVAAVEWTRLSAEMKRV